MINVSNSFSKIFGLNAKQVNGEFLQVLNDDLLNTTLLREPLLELLSDQKEFNDVLIEKEFAIVGNKKLSFNARLIEGHKKKRLILLAIEDITNK